MKRTLALIGAGYWGKNLARNFHALGCLRVICDRSQALLNDYKGQYADVQLSTDSEAVLNDELIKQVAIAVPAVAHYALAKAALLAGKDVFVEKPLCLEVAQAEELAALAEKLGRVLMVGHLLQYHPYLLKLRDLVAEGELGKLHYIVSNRLNLGKIRTEENALWSFAPHDISVILSLIGNHLPERVRCTGEHFLSDGVADTTVTTMRFPGRVLAHVYVSWLNPFKEQKLTVVGSNGMAVFDDMLPWDKKLSLYRKHMTWSDGRTPVPNKVDAEYISVPQSEPLRAECEHFLQCCADRRIPRTDAHEGVRVLRVLNAAQLSLEKDGESEDPRKPAAKPADYFAHPTAVIDAKAKVGKGSKIWHFSHVMADAVMGEGCNLGQNVVVSPHVTLGRNVKVQNNVSIYTGVTCEDDVFLGPSMVFTNVSTPRSEVNRRGDYQTTIVRKGATIGANSTIVCGNELGEYCFVGAGAVITKDVKPYALMVGNPARQVGWMGRHGEKLDLPVSVPMNKTVTAVCPATGDRYMLTAQGIEVLPPSQNQAVGGAIA
jgi:UDP-2-acetamido-3-amino-2,3-dideoxy-glucuronate N-acetyltransferase